MATNENLIPIPGRLHSVATEGHVAGADEIYDDSLQKTQDVINAEIDEVIDDVALIDTTESSPAVVPGFDPQTDTVHVTAQTLSESQKAQVRNNIGLGDVDAKINEAVASEASQRAAAVSGVQASVNAETSRAQAAEADRYTKSETYTKTEVNGLVDTPHQDYVTVDAYANLPATGSKDTIYRVSNYNGSTSQVDASVYSEYAWNGSQYVFLCVKSQIGEVFDISVYNNNAKYADLTAALNGGANIPQSLQKGGMSVKFVQSSDNKYVQYRLILSGSFTNAQFTDVSNWQGVTDEIRDNSKDLIVSRGVYETYNRAKVIENTLNLFTSIFGVGGINSSNGKDTDISSQSRTGFVSIEANAEYYITSHNANKLSLLYAFYYDNNYNYLNYSPLISSNSIISKSFTTVVNAAFVRFVINSVTFDTSKFALYKGSEIKDYIEPYAVSAKNLKDGLPIEKAAFSEKTRNIFTTTFEDGSINSSNGADNTLAQKRSGFIKVSQNTQYVMSCITSEAPNVFVFYYQKDYSYLTYEVLPYGFFPHTFTTPNDCELVRIVTGIFTFTNFQLEVGNVPTDYVEPYMINTKYIGISNEQIAEVVEEIATPLIETQVEEAVEEMAVVTQASYNINVEWEQYGIDKTTGLVDTDSTFVHSQLIEVDKEDTYYLSIKEYKTPYEANAFFYDANGTPVQSEGNYYVSLQPNGFLPRYFVVPQNVSKIRLSLKAAADRSSTMLSKGNMPKPYTPPLQNLIKENMLPPTSIGFKNRKILVLGDSITQPETGWTRFFRGIVQPSAFFNMATGGAMWCDYITGVTPYTQYVNSIGYQAYCAVNNIRIETIGEIPEDIDCIIIAAGTNDIYWEIPTDEEIEANFYLNTYDDSGTYKPYNKVPLADLDRTTWTGAFRWAIETLRNKYGMAKIFVCTPIQRIYMYNYETEIREDGQAHPGISQYSSIIAKNTIIKKLSARLGVEVIDTERCGVCDMDYINWGNTPSSPADGLHVGYRGQLKLMQMISDSFINYFNAYRRSE